MDGLVRNRMIWTKWELENLAEALDVNEDRILLDYMNKVLAILNKRLKTDD